MPSAETALVPYSDSDSSGDEGAQEPSQKRQRPRAAQGETNAPDEPRPASVPAAEVRGVPPFCPLQA